MKKLLIALFVIVFVFSLAPIAHAETDKPTIIWASDPVLPDETVLVRGADFPSDCHIGFVRMTDNNSGNTLQPQTARELQPLQLTTDSLKFVVPADIEPGIFAFWVENEKLISQPYVLNTADAWWLQGDQTEFATPGGWINVFGKCLTFSGNSRLKLIDQTDKEIILETKMVDGYCLEAMIPKTLPAGSYTVWVHNGHGGEAGWTLAGTFEIKKAPAWPEKIFDVTEYGATASDPGYLQYSTGMYAPGQVDSATAIQAAVDAAGANGGGVVYFPRGIYILSKGIEAPPYVTLRGQGKDMVALSWVDDTIERTQSINEQGMQIYDVTKAPHNRPHPYLIRGTHDFAVEDLSIYAVNHHAGIQSQHGYQNDKSGNVFIRRVTMRLDRFINTYSGRHYSDYKDILEQRKKDTRRVGALDIGGNNIHVVDCDIYSSRETMTINRATGRITNCRLFARPAHWIVFARGCEKMIFTDNYCADGGVSLNSTHGIVSNDGKTNYLAQYSRNIYCARNTMRDSYVKDRDGGFNSDFHGPTGFYVDYIKSARDKTITLKYPVEEDIERKWKGAAAIIISGRGAGQYRRITGGQGDTVIIDRPWQVVPDETSLITLSKAHDHIIAVDNTVYDTGNTVLFWCGGMDMIAARNTSVRGGSIQLTALATGYGGILPGMRAQFFDNVIEEGVNWGAAYIFPRGAFIGSVTYPPVYMIKPRGDRDYPAYDGPFCFDQVFRRNTICNNGRFLIGGNVDNALLETCTVEHADIGIAVEKKGGRWSDEMRGGPSNVMIRRAKFDNVKQEYSGSEIEEALIMN